MGSSLLKLLRSGNLRVFSLTFLLTLVGLSAFPHWQRELTRWDKPVITVYNGSSWDESVHAAIRFWNQAGARVRFQLVREREAADIQLADLRSGGCLQRRARGCAQKRWSWRVNRIKLLPRPEHHRDFGQMSGTAAHELGHALGMRHDRSECSLMNPDSECRRWRFQTNGQREACPYQQALSVSQLLCPRAGRRLRLCGPSAAEVARLHAWYGRDRERVPRPRAAQQCEMRVREEWRGWCVFPDYQPSGQARPAWMLQVGGRWHCTTRIPAQSLADRARALRLLERPISLYPSKRAASRRLARQVRARGLLPVLPATSEELHRLLPPGIFPLRESRFSPWRVDAL